MKDVISIIVPVYNVATSLQKCLNSILCQTYTNLEIILVEDGSTDSSGAICDAYASKDSRIKVIHKKNSGLVEARKTGICAAQGEYVGYVDGDDWIESDMYETLLACMTKYHVDMVESDHWMDVDTQFSRSKSKLGYGRFDVDGIRTGMLCDNDFNECRIRPYLWSKLFRRSILEPHQMRADKRIRCGEDIAVTYPYLMEAKSIYIAKYAGYHYVQHQDSMTGILAPQHQEADKALIQYLRTIFQKDSGMLKQLNQYTKTMLLLRQPSFFDKASVKKKLLPFGGIDSKCRVAVYGAGRAGQSLCRYLNQECEHPFMLWADKDYILYRQLGISVSAPEEVIFRQKEYDVLLLAVCSRQTAEGIRSALLADGMEGSKIRWLTEEFIKSEFEVIERYLAGTTE